MPDSPRPHATLSERQRGRLESSRRTVAAARVTDLAALNAADLIILVERLRAHLDDAVRLIDETAN
ncbi:hypothetical protein [Streptomyces sp. NPDC048551]|uniref:hypothetical protein n=1 Tax=Streptomyces sp. NPDC048551 TaxID=3155758 RepID=UPI00342BABDF